MTELDDVRAAFTDPEEFWSSPLYRRLSEVVAADPFLLALAAGVRPGQVPTFAFFGAVHALLLSGGVHPLGDYYPSLRGETARPPDEAAGIALTAFAREHREEIRELLASRLVQTNHVQRAVGLRLAMAVIAPYVDGQPTHLLEVGSSAGLVLRHDRYGYQLGGRHFGGHESPVQLVSDWRGDAPIPNLDVIPSIVSATGIDLNPLDPASDADRLWLEALVWPEDRRKAELLHDALALARETPVVNLPGDAIDLCPQWAAALPAGQPRIVFHCATRMHVPPGRRSAFDDAIDSVEADGPLYRAAIEGDGLVITGPGRSSLARFEVDGHLAWVSPGT